MNKDPRSTTKGPLSFEAGNLRVFIFKNDVSHSDQPCLYSKKKNIHANLFLRFKSRLLMASLQNVIQPGEQ